MEGKVRVIGIILMTVSLIAFSGALYAQTATYPQTFGLTSVNNYVSPLSLYPYSFGTTSVFSPTTNPYFTGYNSLLWPYYGNTLVGPYPGLAGLSPFSSVRTGPSYANIMQAMLYYQYLSYAYQFYMIARSTPMFYQNDIVADYIGSSLYSYATNYNLSPQEAIISFIQQNLL